MSFDLLLSYSLIQQVYGKLRRTLTVLPLRVVTARRKVISSSLSSKFTTCSLLSDSMSYSDSCSASSVSLLPSAPRFASNKLSSTFNWSWGILLALTLAKYEEKIAIAMDLKTVFWPWRQLENQWSLRTQAVENDTIPILQLLEHFSLSQSWMFPILKHCTPRTGRVKFAAKTYNLCQTDLCRRVSDWRRLTMAHLTRPAEISGVSAGLFPETAAGNRAYCSCGTPVSRFLCRTL